MLAVDERIASAVRDPSARLPSALSRLAHLDSALAAAVTEAEVDDVREKAQQVGTPCHTATRALRALAVSVCLLLFVLSSHTR